MRASLQVYLRSRPRRNAGIALAMIVVMSALLRTALNSNVGGPWIFVDELIYSELGRSAFGGFSVRGLPVSGYGNVYPYLIAPAYQLFDNLVSAYAFVKVINALVMSLTAIPVFFAARTIMSRLWALVAAVLAVLIPAMAYTGMVMTENAFYPAFALSVLLLLLALQRPTILRQVLVFVGAFVCFEVRPQGAVVVPAIVLSVVLFIILDAVHGDVGARWYRLWRGVVAFLPTWLIVGLIAVGAVAIQYARGVGLSGLLGAYSITAEDRSRFQLGPVLTWFVAHVAELDLWLGILPFIALLVLIGIGTARAGTREERAFACAAVPLVVMMSLVVSAFVVFANVNRVEERNLFYVGIFGIIAMAWWASRGFRRDQPRWFTFAVGISALLPVTLPLGSLLNQSAVSDTFGLFVPYAINSRIADPELTKIIVAAGVLVGIALLVGLANRSPVWLVLVVAGFFVITGIAVDRRTDKASAAAQAISPPKNWIDRAVPGGAAVKVLFPGGSDPMRVWQAEFFNRSIVDVLTISTPLAGGLPDTVVNVRPNGVVTDRADNVQHAPFVLTDSLTSVAGRALAQDSAFGTRLVQADDPLRIEATASGVYGDGWSGPDVYYARYACTGGVVSMEASLNASIHPNPVTVTPYQGEVALPPTTVTSDVGSVQVRAPLTVLDGVCNIRFHIDPLAIPAEAIGSDDTRPLGIIVRGFSYAPPS